MSHPKEMKITHLIDDETRCHIKNGEYFLHVSSSYKLHFIFHHSLNTILPGRNLEGVAFFVSTDCVGCCAMEDE